MLGWSGCRGQRVCTDQLQRRCTFFSGVDRFRAPNIQKKRATQLDRPGDECDSNSNSGQSEGRRRTTERSQGQGQGQDGVGRRHVAAAEIREREANIDDREGKKLGWEGGRVITD